MLNVSNNSPSELKENQSILFKTLKTPNAGKTVARVLVSVTLVFIVLLFFPWQQNIRGKGKVTAFAPSERPQSVETAIAGRIASWNIIEGQFVNKGDIILTLTEIKDKYFDTLLLERTLEQIEAKKLSIESKQQKVEFLQNQIKALQDGLTISEQKAKNKLQQAQFKLISDSTDNEAEKVRFANFRSQYERNKERFEVGNIPLTKFQDIESKYQESRMKQISAENKFFESQTELINARVNIAGVRAEYQDKISKAQSDLSSTLAEIFDAQGALTKQENEYANLNIRNEQYQLTAPQSGYIVRAMKAGIGETIKEGESVAQIMPEGAQLAVEMYVKALDVPLIEVDRHVRIEFDGWPAIQISGWPGASIGTFGGLVKVIDRVSNGPGDYRILVVPDPNDEPWPEQLRLGSGTRGWVMLDNVPVWYEIWRNLNGFPPNFYETPIDGSEGKDKDMKAEK